MSEQEVIEISDCGRLTAAPVVSVLMITYNHDKYIGQALDSILAQKLDFEYEILIGEDCSTDTTRQVALDYQRRFPEHIRVLYSAKNVGASRNFTRTLEACRGRYVAICEGDDYWGDVLKLAKQVTWLEQEPEYVIAYHNAITINQEGEIIRETLQAECQNGYSSEALQVGAHIPTLTLCFRNVVRQLPPEFMKVVNGDTFLISLLGCHGCAHFINDIAPAVYRHHDGGVWSTVAIDEKLIKSIASYYWLSIYYRRRHCDRLANILTYRIIGMLLHAFLPSAGLAPKWFITFVFPNWYVKIRQLVRIFKRSQKSIEI